MRFRFCVATTMLVLAGCDSSGGSSTASNTNTAGKTANVAPSAAPTPDTSTSEAVQGVTFSVRPRSMSTCVPATVAKVSWKIAVAGVSTGKIFVQGPGTNPTLFAHVGSEGTQDTGAWTLPKTVFILKDAAETKQLAKFTVGLDPCDPAKKG